MQNRLQHNCDKQKRAKVVSDNLSKLCCRRIKRGLPNPECRKAIRFQTYENPVWQRSHRSSPSEGKPRTWRRVAANIFITNLRVVCDTLLDIHRQYFTVCQSTAKFRATSLNGSTGFYSIRKCFSSPTIIYKVGREI